MSKLKAITPAEVFDASNSRVFLPAEEMLNTIRVVLSNDRTRSMCVDFNSHGFYYIVQFNRPPATTAIAEVVQALRDAGWAKVESNMSSGSFSIRFYEHYTDEKPQLPLS